MRAANVVERFPGWRTSLIQAGASPHPLRRLMRGMVERGVFNETRGWHLSPPFRASSGVGDGGEANRVHQPENRSKFRHEETAAPAQAYAQRRSWLAGVIPRPSLAANRREAACLSPTPGCYDTAAVKK